MKAVSPKSFGVVAAICEDATEVHYHPKAFTGGILEFMSPFFLESYMKEIWDLGKPPGNLTSIDWENDPVVKREEVQVLDCVRMSTILKKARVNHVNYFILDVEGAEYEVLKTIPWKHVTFDVFCIETEEKSRPQGYEQLVTDYMSSKGYLKHTRQGRNTWFIHKHFTPSSKPGISKDCYSGANKAANSIATHEYSKGRGKLVERWKPCPGA
jgi:hypothetical protein